MGGYSEDWEGHTKTGSSLDFKLKSLNHYSIAKIQEILLKMMSVSNLILFLLSGNLFLLLCRNHILEAIREVEFPSIMFCKGVI